MMWDVYFAVVPFAAVVGLCVGVFLMLDMPPVPTKGEYRSYLIDMGMLALFSVLWPFGLMYLAARIGASIVDAVDAVWGRWR